MAMFYGNKADMKHFHANNADIFSRRHYLAARLA